MTALEEVNEQVDNLRAQAAGIQRDVSLRIQEIDSDPNLTENGKQNLRDEYRAEAKGRAKVLRDRERSVIEGKIRALETQLDAKIGFGATDLIAFRDAQDRAERIDSSDAASRVMAQAVRSSDRTLAHAVFRKASENGWRDATNQFTTAYPDSAQAAGDIAQLRDAIDNGWFVRSVSYMV